MKKIMIVLAAALFLGACHCKQCAQTNACKYGNSKAACQCHKHHKAGCKCPKCNHKKAEVPPVVVAPAPVPAPKVEEDTAIAEVANVTQNSLGAAVLSFKDPINFRYNSDAMDAESLAVVDKVATALRKYPNAKVRVAGYTDSLGNPAYNMDLSERRAHAVASQLVKDGVPAANVSYIGYGAANPIATNKTAAGRYQNRRVELEITNN